MSNVKTYAGHFQLMMAAQQGKAYIVPFNDDNSDAGLYLSRFTGSLGTSLAARGSVEELERLLAELKG